MKNILWVKKIWLGNFFGSIKIWVGIFLGRKFILAKIYFGLVRFVCVMLLITADLNNNNTEFVGGWVVGYNTQLLLGYG